jgi:alkylation response protein AidB-like acyl-CoA dehydrogenase
MAQHFQRYTAPAAATCNRPRLITAHRAQTKDTGKLGRPAATAYPGSEIKIKIPPTPQPGPSVDRGLASLRTSAVLEAGQWIVSGNKVWTTLAHEADRCLLLVRTDNGGRKHEGITALMVEMKQPGVSVRPITQMNGSRDFAEVTFTQATAPEDAVLGAVGNGWRVAMAALSYERSLHLLQRQLRLSQMAEELRRCVDWSAQPADCSSQMLDVSIAVRGLSSAVRQQLRVIDAGDQVGVEANASKVVWSETYQRLARLGLQLALRQAGPDLRSWTEEYYSSLATSIYAGTNEIQRTIVGERGLGLPR